MNLCDTDFCKGNLGIARAQMPQISDDVMDRLVGYLELLKINISYNRQNVYALKPTQAEIHSDKAIGMYWKYRKGLFPNIQSPIMVSLDGYIIDGHHRWAALKLTRNPQQTIQTITVHLPAKTLIRWIQTFPGVTFES